MFKEERDVYQFTWKDIGNIEEGRPNLGPSTLIAVYRLLQFTLRDVLIKEYDVETAADIFRKAGLLAGSEFCKNVLNTGLDFNAFVADLQEKLKALNIGILRIEKADLDTLSFIMTVEEDLECSGLPPSDETVCDYDEGFIAGILNTYTGKEFTVKEIDCWASGGRVCRFTANIKK
jgi:predicted hydrocarbon binding protein